MIVKKVISKNQSKSNFKNLSRYILDEDNNHAKVLMDYILDNKNNMDKVEIYNFTNCSFDNTNDNIKEILNTQNLNTTTKQDKTMHLVISFQEDEKPSIETMKSIEAEFIKALGMEEHQRLSVVHSNTNNLHIHVAINKINPKTLKVINRYNDFKILQETARKLEEKYNLQLDNHITSNIKKEDKYKHDMTCRFETWVKEKITDEIKNILDNKKTTFNDIKYILAKYDLEFKQRRNGFVIASKSSKLFCKASSIDRYLSKQSLEKRFDELDLSSINLQSVIKFNKFNGMLTNLLYKEYLTKEREKQILKDQELAHIKLLRNEFKNSISSMKFNKLTINHIKNQKTIFNNMAKNIYKKYKKISYREFLIDEAYSGNEEAIKSLQNKEARLLKNDNVLKGDIKQYKLIDKPDYITKEGFIIYKDKNEKIIDKKDHIKIIFDKNSDEVLLKAIKMAMNKYDNLTLNGSETFKHKIVSLVVKYDLDIKFEDKLLNKMVRDLSLKNVQAIKSKDIELNNF